MNRIEMDLIKDVFVKTGCLLTEARDAVKEANGDPELALKLARQKATQRNGSPSSNGTQKTEPHHGSREGQQCFQTPPNLVGTLFIKGVAKMPCCICGKLKQCAMVFVLTQDGDAMGAPVSWNCLRKVHEGLGATLFFAATKFTPKKS